MQTNDRVERFKSEAADLNLKAGNPSSDGKLQILGILLMVAGILVAFLAYSASNGLSDSRDIMSQIILALGGVTLAVTGAALYLRYALGKFLRLFLLRQLYEGQAHIDQVVEAVKTR
jgi:intracellular septation protein A